MKDSVEIDGVTYVRKHTHSSRQLVRCRDSGVFFAIVESRDGQEAVLRNARNIWEWWGASSLNELAVRGTSKPELCKFPVAVDRKVVLDVIEIIDVTEEAAKSIDSVKEWSQHE